LQMRGSKENARYGKEEIVELLICLVLSPSFFSPYLYIFGNLISGYKLFWKPKFFGPDKALSRPCVGVIGLREKVWMEVSRWLMHTM